MLELAFIGLARASDALEIAEMSRDLIEHGLTWSWTPARVQHFISGPESSVVVARRERIAAFAIMHFGDEVAHLNLLAVMPEHRREVFGLDSSWKRLTKTAMEGGVFRINLELRTELSAPDFLFAPGLRSTGRRAGLLSGTRGSRTAHVAAPGKGTDHTARLRAFSSSASSLIKSLVVINVLAAPSGKETVTRHPGRDPGSIDRLHASWT